MRLKTPQIMKSLFIALASTLTPFGAAATGLNLTGNGATGEPGILSVQPGELDFGTVEAGDTAVMTATVANAADPGAEALTLDAMDLGGGGMLGPSTSIVSLTPEGGQWGDHTRFAHITPDGRYVLFPGAVAENATAQLYRHDLWTGTVEMASANAEGDAVTVFGAADDFAISPDGRYAAFKWNGGGLSTPPVPDGQPGFYIRDMDAGVTEYIDMPTTDGELPNGTLTRMSFSADFRIMAFSSGATNLVPEECWERADAEPDEVWYCVYVFDRDANSIERVSVAYDGTPQDFGAWKPIITPDGRNVAFFSWSTNLVPGDNNGTLQAFVHDRETGITEQVSVASDGSEGNDGIWPNGGQFPAISADGRYVAFSSMASNLVPDDTNGKSDVFIRDRVTGTTERVSIAFDGSQSVGATFNPAITPDGRYVAFVGSSEAANLVPGDTNGSGDHFIHDRVTGITERVSVATDGTEGNKHSFASRPGISADGRFVTLASNATNLVPVDTNGKVDIFVRDRGGAALGTEFEITGGDCDVDTVLEPGDSCAVEITFTPDSAGMFEDTLTVETGDEQSASVTLHGTAPQGPVLAFNPLSLDLGEVPVGTTSAPQETTFTNAGDRDATGLIFTAFGGGSDYFDADTTDCGNTLPAGESCQVVITFTPPGEGLTFAALNAESDEVAAARLNLAGEGGPGGGELELIFQDRYEQEGGP